MAVSVIKSISGHTSLKGCHDYLLLGKGAVRDYFEGSDEQDRCIAKDFINMTPSESKAWDQVMDDTRADHGNDGFYGGKRGRTYTHFIVSPNPSDGIDLETLRALATSWAEEHFGFDGKVGPAQVAIMYHDDNSERVARGEPGIPHAHIVVNNTNLETGGRIHFSKAQSRDLATSLSRISKELGLSYFTVDRVERDGKIAYERNHHTPNRYPQRSSEKYDHRPSARNMYRTKTERELIVRGEVPWKDRLRETIEIACNMSRTLPELQANLAAMGVVTEERRGKRAMAGEWIFYFPQEGVAPSENKQRVSGQRLGRKFTPSGLLDMMKLSYYQRLAAADRNEPRIMSIVADINTFHLDKSSDVSLNDISRALAAINANRIQNIAEANKCLQRSRAVIKRDQAKGVDAYRIENFKNLEALVRIADKIDMLPESEWTQKSRPHDFETVMEQRREQSKRKVSLSEKVERGWRLTKAEHDYLKEKRPYDFVEWKRNRSVVEKGETIAHGSKQKPQEGPGKSHSAGSQGDTRIRSR